MSSQSWTRRFSHPTQPTSSYLPTASSLRAALLGYLGEVEAALGESPPSSAQPSASVHSEDDPSSSSASEAGNETSPVSASASSTAWQQRTVPQITRRGTPKETDPLLPHAPQNQTQQPQPQPVQTVPSDTLAHLASLRADVLAYLQQGLGHREWLRNLPSRLSMVDPGDAVVQGSSAIEAARQHVVQVVKALLPPDDWVGWETLGWEQGDGVFHDDEDESEPEYFFPNRTPASARAVAFASMRRARSKSVGDASTLARPTTLFPPQPPLARVRTEPTKVGHAHRRSLSGDHSRLPPLSTDDEAEDERADRDREARDTTPDSALDDEYADDLLAYGHDEELDKLIASGRAVGPTVEEALASSEDGTKLITFDDLPFWWRNNQYIITGYRFIPLHEKTGPFPLIKSAFKLHNETVNIHSHFLPTLFILACIPIIVWSSPLPNAHWFDTTMLVLYLIAAISCLLSSAGWHVLSGCASRTWFEWGACVDYIGISWLIAMSFNTVVYNAYYCYAKTALFYISTNLACGALGSVLPFQRWFNERKNKKWRIAFFLFLCFAMFAPMVQMFYQEGLSRGLTFCAPFSRSVVSYVTGLLFYGFHFPECVWPGKFDRWGASHQAWHIGIVIAIWLHYSAIFAAHDARLSYSCAAPDAGEPVTKLVDGLLSWL